MESKHLIEELKLANEALCEYDLTPRGMDRASQAIRSALAEIERLREDLADYRHDRENGREREAALRTQLSRYREALEKLPGAIADMGRPGVPDPYSIIRQALSQPTGEKCKECGGTGRVHCVERDTIKARHEPDNMARWVRTGETIPCPTCSTEGGEDA